MEIVVLDFHLHGLLVVQVQAEALDVRLVSDRLLLIAFLEDLLPGVSE